MFENFFETLKWVIDQMLGIFTYLYTHIYKFNFI